MKTKRNLTQLRKDNRYSNVAVICSTKGCENEALLIKGPTGERVKVCHDEFFNPKPKQASNRDLLLASMGLITI